MNIFTRYTRHRLPRPRLFTPGDLFGAACLLLIVAVPFIVLGGL
jgi:hypothetical protein